MANLLDRLLPASFMSDVQATFRPKSFDFTTASFLPNFGESSSILGKLKELQSQGFQPSRELANILSGEGRYESVSRAGTVRDKETGEIISMTDFEDMLKDMIDKDSSMMLKLDDPSLAPNIFGGASLAEGFERAGIEGFDSSMAKPASLSSLRDLDVSSYSGQIAQQRGNLASNLQRQREMASQMGGGFAGYGRRGMAEDVAQQQFQSGVEGVLENVDKQRADALQNLFSTLENYGQVIRPMSS